MNVCDRVLLLLLFAIVLAGFRGRALVIALRTANCGRAQRYQPQYKKHQEEKLGDRSQHALTSHLCRLKKHSGL